MKSKAFRFPVVGLLTLMLMATLSVWAHDAEGKELKLKGEVVDLQCYLAHPDSGMGKGHIGCAKACINLGLPVGLLAENGKVYLLLATGHKSLKKEVAPLAGKTVSVTATLLEQNGMQALQVKKFESYD